MLLDGRIGALLDALDEGRQLWRRVQSAVAVLLGGNAGEVAFAIIGSALIGPGPAEHAPVAVGQHAHRCAACALRR